MIVEIGLAVVLVVVAGMFSRFFGEFVNMTWAFDETRVLVVPLKLSSDPARAATSAQLVSDVVTALREIARGRVRIDEPREENV